MRFLLALSWLLAAASGFAQSFDTQAHLAKHYTKAEYDLPMRDGTRLHTTVYSPKKGGPHPILLSRTCYSCRPYGEGQFPNRIFAGEKLLQAGYIFVCQDVRGRWLSEGTFDNMRPQVPKPVPPGKIDESTDTYDTIEWLLANLRNHNGKVGMMGTSYPGFYAAAGSLSGHPALVASSPQAPIADFFFDDFHHMGAYTLGYFFANTVFAYQHNGPTAETWYPSVKTGSKDWYQYLLDMGPLKNGDKIYGEDAFFWQELKDHPNYDEFWQERNLLPHLQGINHAVLIVGGWYDAEDLYGPLKIYQTIEANNPNANNRIVMGPWSHGDWNSRTGRQTIGYTDFGDNATISGFFRNEVQFSFFEYHLKGIGSPHPAEALMYDTGKRAWTSFGQWPPAATETRRLYLHPGGRLLFDQAPGQSQAWTEYLSDPAKPVPHYDDIDMRFTPRPYMAGDQRDMGRRPDVLVFQTEPLTEDITLSGEMLAQLFAATRPLHEGTADSLDADYVVKLIDVYPDDYPDFPTAPAHVVEGGYQQLVRGEIFRGRFRESFSEPIHMVPGAINEVGVPLQDVFHTFRKGHRIMIQVQSSWFPLFDRNPQSWVDNIFEANEADFIPAWQRIYHEAAHPSYVEVKVLK